MSITTKKFGESFERVANLPMREKTENSWNTYLHFKHGQNPLEFAMQNDHRVLYQLLKKDNEKPTPKQILGNHVPKTFTARRWHSGHNGVK